MFINRQVPEFVEFARSADDNGSQRLPVQNSSNPKKLRVTRRKDIARAFESGRRVADRMMTLVAVPNGLGLCRAGVAVSARHGNAVRRNRVKRLCREALRLTRAELPTGWDYMIIPRPRRQFTLQVIQESLRALAGQVARPGANQRRPQP